ARPVVLPPPVVHAITAGAARRVALPLSPQPALVPVDGGGSFWSWWPRKREFLDSMHAKWPQALLEFAPCREGERLWVKETWAPAHGAGQAVVYRADELALRAGGRKWRSPLHMPREASRLCLVVRRVHAERVPWVSERGALVEGVARVATGEGWRYSPFPATGEARPAVYARAREAYAARWDEVYVHRLPWDGDPWVWRLDFDVE